MRRLGLGLLALTLGSAPAAQTPPPRPPQSDAIVRLLADMETALSSNRPDNFRALTAASVPDTDLAPVNQVFAAGPVASATVRERARLPVVGGFEVVADVLMSRGKTGRIATWQLTLRPRVDGADRYEIAGFHEIGGFGGLLQIALDPSKPYAVHNLTLQGPDFTLKMASGSAFAAEAPSGITALVLVGRSEVRFAPPDLGEQGQLKLFSGSPVLASTADAAFVRLNGAEFDEHVSEHALVPDPRAQIDLSRAQGIFNDLAPKSYNLDLDNFSGEHWSIEPPAGNLLVEFHTRRDDWLTYTRSPSDPEDISLFDRGRGKTVSSYASAEKLAARGRFYSEDDQRTYHVERYALDLTIDPSRLWLSGRGSLHLRVAKGPTASITFKLAQSLTVSSVSSPTFGRLLALRVAGRNDVIVSLPSYVMEDTDFTLDIAYGGRLEPQRLEREALDVKGQTLPPGSTVGQQEPGVPTSVIEPEHRFLYSNRALWYPQNAVTDYATATMRLSVPSQYQIVASGSLVSAKVSESRDEGGRGDIRTVRTVEYVADRPVRYLSCLVTRLAPVGRQRVDVPALAPAVRPDRHAGGLDHAAAAASSAASDGGATDKPGVNLEVVATPLVAARSQKLVARAADIVRSYARILGEAPYPDLTIAALEDNLPGGHSPPFFVTVLQPLPTSPFSWANDPVVFDSVYPNFVLAHEIAHQWWGHAIGWKNYHEQWLSEGFAQYFAVLYAGLDRGPDAVRNLIVQMRQWATNYGSQGPISLGFRLGHIQGEGNVFRAIDYDKSAVVLHMLRRLIGDDAFYAGLKRFYREWRFKKAGLDDLRQAFEAETPMKLSRFFDQWITETSIPRVAVSSKLLAADQSVVIRIEQQGEVFDFPYTVSVQYADGHAEDVTIPVTEQSTEHTIALTGPVKRVVTKDDLALVILVK